MSKSELVGSDSRGLNCLPGFILGSIAPLESIVAGVAREVRGCLERGEPERVGVLLTLLEALGGPR